MGAALSEQMTGAPEAGAMEPGVCKTQLAERPSVGSVGVPGSPVGSTYVVVLPSIEAMASEFLDRLRRRPVMPMRYRALVVEDEPDVREFVYRILEDRGYAVEAAHDGEEALAKIAELHPDVVILDLMLPRLDGWGVLERLQVASMRPPVIVVSANPDCPRAVRYGASACLSKPFDIPVLLAACAQAVAGTN